MLNNLNVKQLKEVLDSFFYGTLYLHSTGGAVVVVILYQILIQVSDIEGVSES